MGSGEFGGGGSVTWRVEYDDNQATPAPPGTAKYKAHGKDVGPKTEPGDKLYIFCRNARVLNIDPDPNNVVVEVTLEKDDQQIRLTWGDSVTPDLQKMLKP